MFSALHQIKDLSVRVLTAGVLSAVSKGYEENTLFGLVFISTTLAANRGVGQDVAHGVIERCVASRAKRCGGQWLHLGNRDGVGEDLVGILTIKLDQGHHGVSSVGLLGVYESVKPSDHVVDHRVHRARSVQDKVDM